MTTLNSIGATPFLLAARTADAELMRPVVRFLAEKGATIEVWNQQNKKGWTPLKIAEGVQRGMNIVSSPATAAAIRQVIAATNTKKP